MTAPGFIYFIRAKGDGPIKIGYTGADPRKRMVKIQSDCPWPVVLIGAIKGTVAQEKRIHLVLAHWKTQGEWFAPHEIVIAAVNEALRVGEGFVIGRRAAKHDHPLCQYRRANNLTLRDLSVRTGLSATAISRFESGRNKPNGESIRLLVKATGLTPMQLRPDLQALMEVA